MGAVSAPFPVLPAADIGRASKFYEDVLEFRRSAEQLEGGTMYDVHGGKVWVYETPNAGTAQNTQIAWWVDDIEAEVDRLTQAGVHFETFELPPEVTWDGPIATSGDLRSAWFKDTEGNTLCIDERV